MKDWTLNVGVPNPRANANSFLKAAVIVRDPRISCMILIWWCSSVGNRSNPSNEPERTRMAMRKHFLSRSYVGAADIVNEEERGGVKSFHVSTVVRRLDLSIGSRTAPSCTQELHTYLCTPPADCPTALGILPETLNDSTTWNIWQMRARVARRGEMYSL